MRKRISHANFRLPSVHPVGRKRFSRANFGPCKSSSRTRSGSAIALVQKYACFVRAHRSHRWGRWFESNCHHHSAALVNQGLRSFLSLGLTAVGCTFFRVYLCDVNGSGRHSVHTVVWLSCRKIGVARLMELRLSENKNDQRYKWQNGCNH